MASPNSSYDDIFTTTLENRTGNVKSLKLVKGLGFKTEGLLRRYRSSGEDCYLLGMLKNECKWREK